MDTVDSSVEFDRVIGVGFDTHIFETRISRFDPKFKRFILESPIMFIY